MTVERAARGCKSLFGPHRAGGIDKSNPTRSADPASQPKRKRTAGAGTTAARKKRPAPPPGPPASALAVAVDPNIEGDAALDALNTYLGPSPASVGLAANTPGASAAAFNPEPLDPTLSETPARGLTPGAPPPPNHASRTASGSSTEGRLASISEDISVDDPRERAAIDNGTEALETAAAQQSGDARPEALSERAKRKKVKDGEGERAKKWRQEVRSLKRELDVTKSKAGYNRNLKTLYKTFMKATKQFGGEGVIFIGHPDIVKHRRRIQLDGKKGRSSHHTELVYDRFASAAFRSQKRTLSIENLVFAEDSLDLAPTSSNPPPVPFQSLLHSMEDLYVHAYTNIQASSNYNEKVKEINAKYEQKLQKVKVEKETLRKILRRKGFSDEEIDRDIAQEEEIERVERERIEAERDAELRRDVGPEGEEDTDREGAGLSSDDDDDEDDE